MSWAFSKLDFINFDKREGYIFYLDLSFSKFDIHKLIIVDHISLCLGMANEWSQAEF